MAVCCERSLAFGRWTLPFLRAGDFNASTGQVRITQRQIHRLEKVFLFSRLISSVQRSLEEDDFTKSFNARIVHNAFHEFNFEMQSSTWYDRWNRLRVKDPTDPFFVFIQFLCRVVRNNFSLPFISFFFRLFVQLPPLLLRASRWK